MPAIKEFLSLAQTAGGILITFSTQVSRIRWTEQGDERVELPARFLPEGRLLLPKDVDATFEALQVVGERVKRLSKVDRSGTALMSHVFDPTTPKLDVTTATGQNTDDERAGFALLFKGAIQGLRDPRGHGTPIVDQPGEALEYLALASLLMRRLDIAEGQLSGA